MYVNVSAFSALHIFPIRKGVVSAELYVDAGHGLK